MKTIAAKPGILITGYFSDFSFQVRVQCLYPGDLAPRGYTRGSPRRQHSGIQHHHCPPSPEWEPPASFSSISAAFLLLRLCEAPHEHRSPGSDRGAVTLMSWPQEPSGRPPHGPVSSFHFPSSPVWTSVLSPALPKHATREVGAPCEPQWGNGIWCCACLVGGRQELQ